ncbi:DUF499 domain-containing protein [Salinibacterium sp. NG253]|uniref:DUF499 domain-containing protein n=1 Tax=Salinibacterium sp. NG253 TaxID=2792039 RepID=UPI0018CD8D28|nr:DUF499 domain-containing protein [Salinibacterium sp. NG253]MBH0116998.1 DUF499 domain-containing protein [Salinibacterium sp. NG253]
MAEFSNKDRVRRALDDVFAPALRAFIESVLGPGDDWTQIVETRFPGNVYEPYDPQSQLYLISLPWPAGRRNPFWDELSKTATKAWSSELLDVRNKANHNRPWQPKEAERALDTMVLLLREIHDPRAADIVDAERREIVKSSQVAEAKKDSKRLAAMPTLDAGDVPAWRDVLEPHPDVAAGDFVSAEFAADLYQVANGHAGADYADPIEFFRRTYLTEGIQTLLKHVARRVAGDTNAEPIINLQTTFGGGKTHAMLAAWHLFSGRPLNNFPQAVQDLLEDLVPAETFTAPVRRVAIVGNELSPGQSWMRDGTEIHTIWGELAWQLGGAAGYALVADSDRNGTNPGHALRTLLQTYGPAVILIDEWVAYARGLVSKDGLPGGDFGEQRSFAQALNAAVKGTPGTVLLVSLPASEARTDDDTVSAHDIEIGGPRGRDALDMLDHTMTRDAYRWAPAKPIESFEIVKRRLFREPDAAALTTIEQVARRFTKFYTDHKGELPGESLDYGYEDRIRAAYPIHPALFDRLYGDWSMLERFQRTRGVLRLMSQVVHSLWVAGDRAPLIMPGSIPLDSDAVRDEIAGYLPDEWQPIIAKDIDGELSNAVYIDNEKPLFGARALTRRIARSIFMGSAATLTTEHKGIARKQVFLSVALPGDTIGNFGSALSQLTERATHLYVDSDRFWFDRTPSLNRTVAERADSYQPADVWAEITSRLRQEPKSTTEISEVIIAPEDTSDVDEKDRVRLVIAHPRYTHEQKGKDTTGRLWAREVTSKRGAGGRINANSVVVLTADSARLKELEQSVRHYLAWRSIYDSRSALNLTESQTNEAKSKIDQFNGIVKQRIRETWIWALHAQQDAGDQQWAISQLKVDGATDSIARHVAERLRRNDIVQVQHSPTSIGIALTNHLRAKWNSGRVTVGELWEYHSRYPYLPRLRDKSVLTDAVGAVMDDMAWDAHGFALATRYDESTGDFDGLRLPIEDHAPAITDQTLLVSPTLARAQRERERAQQQPESIDDSTSAPETTTAASLVSPSLPAIQNVNYAARVDLRPAGDLAAQVKAIAEEVLVHLQQAAPDSLEIRIEIDASKLGGFETNLARTVKENGATLGFKGQGFTSE